MLCDHLPRSKPDQAADDEDADKGADEADDDEGEDGGEDEDDTDDVLKPADGPSKRRPRERVNKDDQYEADFIDDTEVIIHRKAGAAKTKESGFFIHMVRDDSSC